LTRSIAGREETLHLRALATPLVHNNDRYTLLAIAPVGEHQESQRLPAQPADRRGKNLSKRPKSV
jgi:hypothetical protein